MKLGCGMKVKIKEKFGMSELGGEHLRLKFVVPLGGFEILLRLSLSTELSSRTPYIPSKLVFSVDLQKIIFSFIINLKAKKSQMEQADEV